MSSKTPRGLRTRAREAAATQNNRITARIIQTADGTRRHEYRRNGRVYSSLDELLDDSPESTHAQPTRSETHVIDTEGGHV